MLEWLNNPSLRWLFILEEVVFIAVLLGIIWFINRLYGSPPQPAIITPWVFITLGLGLVVGWYCYLFFFWPSGGEQGLAYMMSGYGGVMGVLMLSPTKFFQRQMWYQSLFQRRVLILSGYGADNYLPLEILRPSHSRYRIMGILNDDPSLKGKKFKGVEVLGNSRELGRIINQLRIQQVVVAIGQQRGQLPLNVLLDCRSTGIRVLELADFYEQVTGKIRLQNLRPSWFIFNPGFKSAAATRYIKRLLDILLSSLGLLMGLPGWIVVGLGWIGCKAQGSRLKAQSPFHLSAFTFERRKHKLLIASPRVGEQGRVFNMFTFSPEVQQGLAGRILRALAMDKLPALINVLQGEMSLVGPHADEPELATEYERLFPYYNKQLRVKPGLLSWAMVNQVNDADRHNLRERWQYDLYYAKWASLQLDCKIAVKGIKLLFLGDKKVRSIGYEGVQQW